MSSIKISANGRTVEFGVMKFPNRKNKCLYKTRGAMVEPLAYFRTEEDAHDFDEIIEFMLQLCGINQNKGT